MSHKLSWTFDRLYKLNSSKVKQTHSSDKRTVNFHTGNYKSRKCRGIFRWPNGACYNGEFVGNKRHGDGKQQWPDGSSYVGEFQNDVREGYGKHTWFNGEVYEGTFLRDKRHGNGIYRWPDGTQYEGHFFNDLKHGYGRFHFPDGKTFQGIYKNNQRNGAGILSYCDDRQDVGIWLGEKLIRLCTVMENTFLFQHFSDYFVNAGENVSSKVKRANSALADARTINEVEDRKQVNECVEDKNNIASFYHKIPETLPLDDILDGIRHSSHGPKGPCELGSVEFLRVSGQGDCARVIELLEEGLVHVDVADKTGYTALLAASVNCHKDVINCLLDYGADVNKLNYEGLSPLAACHVLFYTKHTWNDNIGETLSSENLFNSVHWDTKSGTFVQRKPVYYQSKTSSKNVHTENSSQSSVFKVDESTKDNVKHASSNELNTVPDETIEKVENVTRAESEIIPILVDNCQDYNEDDEVSNSCHGDHILNKEQNLKVESSRTETVLDKMVGNEKKIVESIIKEPVTSNKSSEPELVHEKKTTSLNKQHVDHELKVLNRRSDVDESNVQRSEILDKNTFIHVFLNRTASARSKQNSSNSCFGNVDSSYEESFSENRNDVHCYQVKNSRSLLEGNKGCDKKDYMQESNQYSLQNAISSSVQTTNIVEDTDSLMSVEQNRQKLLTQQRRPHLEATVQLLLRRGANPNASSLPMPVLFFAIKAADAPAVKLLLEKGADTNTRLSKEKLGITPLHIAVALPSDAILISKLLLEAGSDPNLRDFAFGDVENGRTALHTACCREDNDEDANRVISLLLDYKADPNLLCNGHSALSLVIGSGNDLAVETLLKRNANPSLSLTHGVGSPLCAAVSFTAEKRRKLVDHVRLVNKLIRSGGNILAPIIINDEHPPGTVVDYAHNVFHQDRRIAHTPYHALSPYEREIYVTRRKMLDHLAELLRTHVLKKEKKLLEEQLSRAKVSQEQSCENINEDNLDRAVSFYFDELRSEQSVSEFGSSLEKESIYNESHGTMSSFSFSDNRFPDCGLRVAVVQTPSNHMNISRLSINSTKKHQLIRKTRFRYCYECGRSVGVRLAACTRCKQVFYCSRNCKLKAWNSRHREECIRLSARNKSSLSGRTDSPTSITNAGKDSTLMSNSRDSIVKHQNSRNRPKLSSKEKLSAREQTV